MRKRKLLTIILAIIIISNMLTLVGCNKNQVSTVQENNETVKEEVNSEVKEVAKEEAQVLAKEEKNPYEVYYDIVKSVVDNNGICGENFPSDTGIIYVDLVDFDGDKLSELYMIYLDKKSKNGSNSNAITEEIWKLKDGIPVKVVSKGESNQGLVSDRSIAIAKANSKSYILYNSSYSHGRGKEPYTIVSSTTSQYLSLENDKLVEVANINKHDEATVEGDKRIRYTSGKLGNEKELSKEDYEEVNKKFKSDGIKEIILGNAGSPSLAIDMKNNIKTISDFLIKLNKKITSDSKIPISLEEVIKSIEKVYESKIKYKINGKMNKGSTIDGKPSEEYYIVGGTMDGYEIQGAFYVHEITGQVYMAYSGGSIQRLPDKTIVSDPANE